ncbi:RICIN domain-containing protein [Dactylosporangium siamense]|uniref:GH12 family glycosyl hydrolase domain-containing protein n=1 Tax=Dactylosporangium siamense TaxID=685454 RepID=UPI0019442F4C|nr:RICIN domain-containing protein [Dactylosporangium siamense]
MLPRVRAILAAAACVAAATVALVPTTSAHADTVICEKFGSTAVQGGKYYVQNNNWGDDTTQCINVTANGFQLTRSDHNKPTNGAPGSYPSIFAGCHYTLCTSGSGMPMRVSDATFQNVNTSVSMTYAGGQWDAAYDVWFDPTPRTDGQNTGAELMVWLNHAGAPQPVGGRVATVNLAGGTWDVWFGNIGWNVVSYVRTAGTGSISFAVRDFYNDMLARGYAQNSWYMTSVQAGFEPWQGGAGMAVTNFSYSTTGGGGGGQTIVGQGSGRCVDVNAQGTADGTKVQLWDCNGSGAQKWNRSGNTFVNPQSGKCLDVRGASTANGAQVWLWTCLNNSAQQWVVNGNGTIVNPASGKCLDATGRGTANGTGLQIWDCYGGPGTQSNQVWSLR